MTRLIPVFVTLWLAAVTISGSGQQEASPEHARKGSDAESGLASQTGSVTFQASSLNRGDIPDDLPWPMLYKGFAVFRITIRNDSPHSWRLHPEAIQVQDKKRKTLKRATSAQVTPEVMKFYSAGGRRINAEAHAGVSTWEDKPGEQRPPATRRIPLTPTSAPNPSAGTVSASLAQELRSILEHYEVKEVEVPAGGTYEGLLYVKSKKFGNKLSGSVIRFGDDGSATAP